MTRVLSTRGALVVVAVAIATTAWHASPDAPIVTSDPAAAAKAIALATLGHAPAPAMAARVPAPCARSEQPHRSTGRLDACVGAPATMPPSPHTPLYALLRVFRL